MELICKTHDRGGKGRMTRSGLEHELEGTLTYGHLLLVLVEFWRFLP